MTEKPKTKILKNLKVREIAICASPINGSARTSIWKSEPEESTEEIEPGLLAKFLKAVMPKAGGPIDFTTAMAAEKVQDKINEAQRGMWRAESAMRQAVNSIVTSTADNKAEMLKTVMDQYHAELTKIIPSLAITKALGDGNLDLGEGASTMTIEELAKSVATMETTVAELTNAKDTAEAEVAKLTGFLKAANIDPNTGVVAKADDVLKGVPEEVRVRLEKAEAENKANAVALATLVEKGEVAEEVKKAAVEFPKLPVKAEDLGAALYRTRKGKATADDVALIEKALKAGSEGIALSLVVKGRGGNAANTGTAYVQLTSKAQEIRKAEPALTDAQAFEKAMIANPALYDAYKEERASGTA